MSSVARATLVLGLLVATAAGWQPALQPARAAARLPRHPARTAALGPRAHGGGHHHHGDGESQAVSMPMGAAALLELQPGLAALWSYLRVQVFRPLMLHCIISWSTLRRHAEMRTAMKKAEFELDASRITWIGAAVNLALAAFKLAAGVLGCSAAMIADAGHSFSDLISDGLTLLALRLASLPADVDHPYGHGRFESVASLAIGSLLVAAGASFGASAHPAHRTPAIAPLGTIALWAALSSIVAKEILFRATERIGRKLGSPVLLANAWHHRSDALSSVVALVGIGGSLLGMPLLDPLAGMLVAWMVLSMGVQISLEALAQLTDTSDYGMVQEVQQVAEAVPGVDLVDHVRARSMGGSALVDLAIQVDPTLSASCAHHLAEEVRTKVMAEAAQPVSEVLVHVDTSRHDAACPLQSHVLSSSRHYEEVEADVARLLSTLPEVGATPRVRVFYLQGGLSVEAHVCVGDELTVGEAREVASRGERLLLASSADVTEARIAVDVSEGAARPASVVPEPQAV